MYSVVWTKQAKKDHRFIVGNALAVKLAEILNTVRASPFESTPSHCFEKLKGYNPPIYTRRLDYYNRFVYTVESNVNGAKDRNGILYDGIVVIHRMWGHFPP
jgi:Txe/YoeB family toxin of Txe-Axe toxin-antitoxin module